MVLRFKVTRVALRCHPTSGKKLGSCECHCHNQASPPSESLYVLITQLKGMLIYEKTECARCSHVAWRYLGTAGQQWVFAGSTPTY